MGTAKMQEGVVSYYLLTQTHTYEEKPYGLLVEYLGEQAEVRNLSKSKKAIEELLAAMQRGTVTPISVPDVVEDWIL